MSEKKRKGNIIFRIFSKIWSILRVYLVGVGLFWTIVPLTIALLLSRNVDVETKSFEQPVEVLTDSYIEMEFEGVFVESVDESFQSVFSRAFGGVKAIDVFKYKQKVIDIAHSDNIKGVLLKVGGTSISSIHVDELNDAFRLLKEKGKKLWVYGDSFDDNSYLIASHADKIAMAPGGQVVLLGTNIQQTYFGRALGKLGVEFEVVRAGKYKSLAEPFVGNKPSEASDLMYRELVGDLTGYLVERISTNLGDTNEKIVSEWIGKSFHSSNDALISGIVDELVHYEDFKEGIEKLFVDNSAESMKFKPLSKVYIEDASSYKTVDSLHKLLLLRYSGEIKMDHGGDSDVIYPQKVKKEVDWALKQTDIKAAVIRIDSPGGSALASEIIWHHIQRLKQKMPVIVSMGSLAASGGYYMASAGNMILASRRTVTGSIGVIGMIPNLKAFDEKYGISFFNYGKSQRESLLNPGKKLSEGDKKVLAQSIEEVYQLFLDRVAKARNTGKKDIHAVAQGRVWSAEGALKANLVDKIGGLSDAYREAKLAAELDPEKLYPVVRPQIKKSLMECLNSGRINDCIDGGFDLKALKSYFLTNSEKRVLETINAKVRMVNDISKEPIQARHIW